MTRLLGCHESTIEAAVTRGDLPPPVALMGRKVWMVGVICDRLGLTTLKYQRLENLVKAIGLPKEKLCTYCWDGHIPE